MRRDPDNRLEAGPLSVGAGRPSCMDPAAAPPVRFYTDERFPARAIELLRSVGARVQTADEANLSGASAEDHAAYARMRGMALLSLDRHFLDDRRFPPQRGPAIFVFHFGEGSLADMRRAFRCVAPALLSLRDGGRSGKVDARCNAWVEHVHLSDGTQTHTSRRLWRGKLEEWSATPA
ncbi:MAG TPA: DUF5615 family PIN-like protein [Dyella sp.]|uniref:DUF5615 family PIN-like protein n=1 Tax=Dyella sp. TaxID=1869338 RepID=UPI002D785717|nr:DUF5615 family PIN-like protein [Dyella sp.]HET6555315.1 DUF5615 family PIN-like protein [Dyella sp.]